jgi:hypothetical protein
MNERNPSSWQDAAALHDVAALQNTPLVPTRSSRSVRGLMVGMRERFSYETSRMYATLEYQGTMSIMRGPFPRC